ncbi:hypothetical protein AAG570_010684 [Ranatra chinensis]|uniref:Uncharacterized protein n=1 Tax=Ranatra chinensis TaxID=642074 RepID=A0ABD0YZ72_9HEMI
MPIGTATCDPRTIKSDDIGNILKPAYTIGSSNGNELGSEDCRRTCSMGLRNESPKYTEPSRSPLGIARPQTIASTLPANQRTQEEIRTGTPQRERRPIIRSRSGKGQGGIRDDGMVPLKHSVAKCLDNITMPQDPKKDYDGDTDIIENTESVVAPVVITKNQAGTLVKGKQDLRKPRVVDSLGNGKTGSKVDCRDSNSGWNMATRISLNNRLPLKQTVFNNSRRSSSTTESIYLSAEDDNEDGSRKTMLHMSKGRRTDLYRRRQRSIDWDLNPIITHTDSNGTTPSYPSFNSLHKIIGGSVQRNACCVHDESTGTPWKSSKRDDDTQKRHDSYRKRSPIYDIPMPPYFPASKECPTQKSARSDAYEEGGKKERGNIWGDEVRGVRNKPLNFGTKTGQKQEVCRDVAARKIPVEIRAQEKRDPVISHPQTVISRLQKTCPVVQDKKVSIERSTENPQGTESHLRRKCAANDRRGITTSTSKQVLSEEQKKPSMPNCENQQKGRVQLDYLARKREMAFEKKDKTSAVPVTGPEHHITETAIPTPECTETQTSRPGLKNFLRKNSGFRTRIIFSGNSYTQNKHPGAPENDVAVLTVGAPSSRVPAGNSVSSSDSPKRAGTAGSPAGLGNVRPEGVARSCSPPCQRVHDPAHLALRDAGNGRAVRQIRAQTTNPDGSHAENTLQSSEQNVNYVRII